MRKVYLLLLHLYPREQRLRFSAEMLEVFTRACQEHRERGWLACTRFAIREFAGLVAGAPGTWPGRARVAPVLGGIVLAGLLHSVSYAALLRISRVTTASVERSYIPRLEPPAALVLMVIVSLLYLLLFLLLSVRMLQRRR